MNYWKEKIYKILQSPQLAGLATVTEDSKPWVRYVMIITSEDLTIRCATFVNARKAVQIKNNSQVHLTCGVSDPKVHVPYLQIQGTAELKTDKEERHGLWNDMYKGIFQGPDDPNYGVIVVKPYRIEYCTPGTLEPEVWSLE